MGTYKTLSKFSKEAEGCLATDAQIEKKLMLVIIERCQNTQCAARCIRL